MVRSSSSKDSVKSSSSSTTGTSIEDSEVDESSDNEVATKSSSNEDIPEYDEDEDDEIESDSYDFIPPSNEPRVTVPGLRPSLFPFVPPYIHFCRHDQMSGMLPAEIRKKLKWRLSQITPIVVKKTVEASGFRLLRNTVEWTGQWGKHMKASLFRPSVKDYQKLNHLPGTFQIGRKDRLWRNLQKYMSKHGKEEFGFMPHTYVLPRELKKLKHAWFSAENKGNPWIVKPVSLKLR
jgi:tubulin polyglutamylase TTLL4